MIFRKYSNPEKSPDYLANLRQRVECIKLPGQAKKDRKVTFFENPEASTVPLLQVRQRPNHPTCLTNVNHIECYEMSGININDNFTANQGTRF